MLVSALCFLITTVVVFTVFAIAHRCGETITRGEIAIGLAVMLFSIIPFFGLVVTIVSILGCIAFAYEYYKDAVDDWFNKPVLKSNDVQPHEDDQ